MRIIRTLLVLALMSIAVSGGAQAPPTVVSVTVSPQATSIMLGNSVQLVAHARWSDSSTTVFGGGVEPTGFTIIAQPKASYTGKTVKGAPAVQVVSASGEAVSDVGVSVKIAKASGTGTLSGTLVAVTDLHGIATFPSAVISGPGKYTLKFYAPAAPSLAAITSDSFAVSRCQKRTRC